MHTGYILDVVDATIWGNQPRKALVKVSNAAFSLYDPNCKDMIQIGQNHISRKAEQFLKDFGVDLREMLSGTTLKD